MMHALNSNSKYFPVHKTSAYIIVVSQELLSNIVGPACLSIFLSVEVLLHKLCTYLPLISWNIWSYEIILVSVIILVSNGCYCWQSNGEAWGVSWLSSPRTLQLCWASEEEIWLSVTITTPVTREWRRVLRLRLTPRMTWAVLTRSCKREITSGLLKMSVKNYSIRRAQRLWLCWHACNSCKLYKFWCLGSL